MDGLKLINPEFDFEFAGTVYKVKKATLEKIIQFQTKFGELSKAGDPAIEKKIAAYCLYLILSGSNPEITEDFVSQNCPDVEVSDVIEQFAFMNRQKVEILRASLNGTPRNAPAQKTEDPGPTGA